MTTRGGHFVVDIIGVSQQLLQYRTQRLSKYKPYTFTVRRLVNVKFEPLPGHSTRYQNGEKFWGVETTTRLLKFTRCFPTRGVHQGQRITTTDLESGCMVQKFSEVMKARMKQGQRLKNGKMWTEYLKEGGCLGSETKCQSKFEGYMKQLYPLNKDAGTPEWIQTYGEILTSQF